MVYMQINNNYLLLCYSIVTNGAVSRNYRNLPNSNELKTNNAIMIFSLKYERTVHHATFPVAVDRVRTKNSTTVTRHDMLWSIVLIVTAVAMSATRASGFVGCQIIADDECEYPHFPWGLCDSTPLDAASVIALCNERFSSMIMHATSDAYFGNELVISGFESMIHWVSKHKKCRIPLLILNLLPFSSV